MKIKRLFLSICIIFIFCGILAAQDYRKIDSLKKVLTTLPPMTGTEADTLLMKISIDIGTLFYSFQTDSAEYWFTSIADTVFSEAEIKQYPHRYLFNASALRYLGSVFENNGDNSKSIDYYERSLKIYEVLGKKSEISKCYNNIGIVFKEQGDYPNAIKYYNKSLKIKEELGDKKSISACLTNLGNVFGEQGDYPKAEEYFEKSLKISAEFGDKRVISQCLNNLGILFFNQGNYSKAIIYYEKALKLAEGFGGKGIMSRCLMNLGLAYMDLENYPKAKIYFEKSLKIKEELGDKSGIAASIFNLGNLYKQLGDYSKALEYYEKSLKITEELGNKRGKSYCLINLGEMFYEQGDYPKAKEYFEKSFKIDEELCLFADLADYYPNLASVYVKQNQYKEAAIIYLKAVRMKRKLIQDNFSILSEKEKGDFLIITGEIFNTLNDYANITKADSILTQCYDNELLLKGLLLNSSSSMMQEVINSKDTTLTNTYWRFKQLRNKISELQSTPIDERKLNLDSIEKLANVDERNLVKLSKDFANIQKQYTYKWKDVQKNLNSDDIAIEFIRINYKLDRPVGNKTDSIGYAALILRSDSKYPQIESICSEAALQKMVGDLCWSDATLCKLIYKTDSKKGLRLYDFIWKPIEPYLTGVKNIYIAPVGVLNQISFAAIPIPDKKLLSDQYNLNLVSSTRVLIENEENKKLKLVDAVIYGGIKYDSDSLYIKTIAQNNKMDETQLRSEFKKSDTAKTKINKWSYLPGTELEANKINYLLKKKKIRTKYYSGYYGLEENFKENKNSPSIIHIATHGFSFPAPVKGMEYTLFENSFVHNLNPLFRSGLLFAGANRTWSGAKPIEGIDDGVLTAYEVSNLNLSNTKLVVLSACETGLGDLKGNEGVYGLQRAFKMAGVKYIVMSLWQVPDAQTVELMEYFYKELLSGKTVREAFVKAQNKMKIKYEPYYWAAFVLVE